jgi:hypothetical protein
MDASALRRRASRAASRRAAALIRPRGRHRPGHDRDHDRRPDIRTRSGSRPARRQRVPGNGVVEADRSVAPTGAADVGPIASRPTGR